MGNGRAEKITGVKLIGNIKTLDIEVSNETHLFYANEGISTSNSHSASYACLTARTAYIKARFPAQYLGACISNEKDMDKIKPILAECKRKGIEVKPPCINTGELRFYGNDKTIFYGLQGINGLGSSAISPILEERRANGNFDSFYSFWNRCKPNKKTIVALAKAGALDSFINRSSVLDNIVDIMKQANYFKKVIKRLEKRKQECLIDYAEKRNIRNIALLQDAQVDYDALVFDIPYTAPMPIKDVLRNEMESIGCYLSGHPLDEYKGVYDTDKINELEDGEVVCLLVNIVDADTRVSKKGKKFCIMKLMSLEEEFEALIFAKELVKYDKHINVGENVIIKGEVKKDNEHAEAKLFINKIGEIKY